MPWDMFLCWMCSVPVPVGYPPPCPALSGGTKGSALPGTALLLFSPAMWVAIGCLFSAEIGKGQCY